MLRSTLLCSAIAAAPASAEGGFIDHFKSLDPSRWYVAHYDFRHPHFDTDWRRENVEILANPSETGLKLHLHPHSDGINRFAGASVRTHTPSHYGFYEAEFRAAKGPGLVTGIFTYTGPHYGTRHDEIDIEVLGRDTTSLNIAWFVDGALHQRTVPLGFDAADCIHTYGFHWQLDRITWFINGKAIFEVNDTQALIPKVPGHFFVNLWAADPSIKAWAGVAEASQRANANVKTLAFTPSSSETDKVEKVRFKRVAHPSDQ
ncbi:MAG: family 16 glycosylhydrolase [Pseudomonadota bacterium]|nr:family 16 glycosylhydrolase [Pseudomonadota bacterium]